MTYTDRDHLERSREYQALYDDAMREVGVRIPAPVLGQTVNEYRRKTLHAFQQATIPRNHPLHSVDFKCLQNDALQVIEPQLLQAVQGRAHQSCERSSRAAKANQGLQPLWSCDHDKVHWPRKLRQTNGKSRQACGRLHTTLDRYNSDVQFASWQMRTRNGVRGCFRGSTCDV